jgi:rhodanese-related sulfurtransferase
MPASLFPLVCLVRLILAAVIYALSSSPPAAQVLADDVCPVLYNDNVHPACGQERSSASVPVAELTPKQAWLLKQRRRETVLFIDLRDHGDAARSQPEGIDAVVPYRELGGAGPRESSNSAAGLNTRFSARIDIEVHARGRGRSMPIVLICGTGELAYHAATTLQTMGYLDLSVVTGGVEGGTDRAGLASPGWKQAGLPWHQPAAAPEVLSLVAQ